MESAVSCIEKYGLKKKPTKRACLFSQLICENQPIKKSVCINNDTILIKIYFKRTFKWSQFSQK